MEDIKSEMQMDVHMELHMCISKKAEKNGIDKDDAIEIGGYVAANFMRTIFKEKGKVSREEISAIFENINDFYSASFKGQFNKEDASKISDSAMKILQSPNSDQIIDKFFKDIYYS